MLYNTDEKRFLLYFFFSRGILVGHVKGNGIRVTANQFPEIDSIKERQCEQLKMHVPPVYVLQNAGVLNAFAMRFISDDFVVIYSELFSLTIDQRIPELSFVIGHELGHIKRNYAIKKLFLFPSAFVPFLSSAYSRACEYICDNIGAALCPVGAQRG